MINYPRHARFIVLCPCLLLRIFAVLIAADANVVAPFCLVRGSRRCGLGRRHRDRVGGSRSCSCRRRVSSTWQWQWGLGLVNVEESAKIIVIEEAL